MLRAAGLIVALSAPLGCAAYMSAVDDGPRRWVCETTCLDIVGLLGGLVEGATGQTRPKRSRGVGPRNALAVGCAVECTGAPLMLLLILGTRAAAWCRRWCEPWYRQGMSFVHVVGANPRSGACCCWVLLGAAGLLRLQCWLQLLLLQETGLSNEKQE